jgi:tetratricopeptide (TPR) repeat protein
MKTQHLSASVAERVATFQSLLKSHHLTAQKSLIAELTDEERSEWLDDAEGVEGFAEHCYQLADFKRHRALTLRLMRLGVEREVTLGLEVRRLTRMHRDWQAFRRLEDHADLVSKSTPLKVQRCVLLGRLRRLRSARQVFEEIRGELAVPEQRYLDARLHWMADDRKQALEIFLDVADDKEEDPMYWVRRVYLQLEMGKLEESQESVQQAQQRFPESLAVLLAQVSIHEVLDQKGAAAGALRRLLEISPESLYAKWGTPHLEFLSCDESPDVLLPVRTLQQKKHYCGPNTLSLLAKFWGRDVDQEDIAVEIWDQGTSTRQMAEWARRNEFDVRLFKGEPDRIKRLLDLGMPVLTERAWAQGGHYFVFVGYSDRREEFYLRDPDAFDLVRYKYADFDKLFQGHDCWCMVMIPVERKALLDGLDFPAEEAMRTVDRIQDQLYKDDPRVLLEELEATDLSAVPNRRDLLQLYLADELNDTERMREAGQAVIERAGDDGNILGRVVRCWCGKVSDEECLGLSTRALSLATQPGTLNHHIRLLVVQGRYSEAQWWAERMLNYFPSDASSYLTNADLLASLHAEERAVEFLSIAEEIDTGDPFLMSRLAMSLTTVGHFDRALEYLDEAVKVRPTYFYPRYCRAYCLESAGRHEDAVASYRENIGANPWYLYNYRQLASLLEDAGDCDGAESVIKDGITSATTACNMGLDLGYLYQRQGRMDEARKQFESLQAEFPSYTPALVGLARLDLIEGNLEDAVALLQKAIEEVPDMYFAVNMLADCYERLGRHEDEITLLWNWVRSFPLNSDFDARLLTELENVGRKQELIDFFSEGAAGKIQPAIFCCRLANASQYLADYPCMDSWSARAIELAPRKAWARAIRGDFLWYSQDYEGAVEAYREALARRPGYVWPMQRLAEYFLRKHDDTAIEYAKQLVAWDSSYLAFLIEVFQSLGLDEEAYRFLSEEGNIARLQHDVQTYCGIIQKRLGNVEVARRHLERALELSPHSVWALGSLAEVLEHQGDFDLAESTLRNAIRLDPDHLWVRQLMADFLLGQGREEEAVEQAIEAMRRRPNSVEVQNMVRSTYGRLGRSDSGAEFFRQFAEDVSSPSDLWSQIGALCLDCDEPDKALEALKKALNLDSENGWAVRLEGIAYQSMQSFKKAEAAFQRSLELDPHDPIAWYHLSHIYGNRGEFERAIEVVEARAAVAPDDIEILSLLFDLCREGGLWEEGERHFAELESRTVHRQHTWLYRGALRELSGAPEHALEAYDRALETNPTFQDGLHRRALLLFKLRRREDALADLSRVLELNPRNADTLRTYLWNLDPRKEAEVGFAALQRALASEPDDAELYNLVNSYAERVGDPFGALEIFRSLEGKISSPHVLACYTGGACVLADDLEQAEDYFRRALAAREDFYWAHSRLGDVYRLCGEDDRAIECWSRAMQLEPDYSWTYQALIDLYRERGDEENQWRICARRLVSGPDNTLYQYEFQQLAVATGRVQMFDDFVGDLLERSRAPHELLTRIAQVYYAAGQYETALKRVDRAIGLNPRAWWTQAKKGDILQALRRPDEAVPFYEAALQLKPDESHSAIQLFEIRKAGGKVDQMREEFLQFIERMPDQEELFSAYQRHFSARNAVESAEKLVEISSRVSQPMLPLITAANMLVRARRKKRAVEILQRVQSEFPRRPEVYVRLSDIYQADKKWLPLEHVVLSGMSKLQRPSLELFESLFQAPPAGRSVLGGLKTRDFVAGLGNCRAVEDVDRLVQASIRENRAGKVLANADSLAIAAVVAVDAIRRRKFGVAEGIVNTILEIQPTHVYGLYLRSDVLTRMRRNDEAVRALRKLGDMRDDSETDRFVEMLAINYLGLGDLERAEGLAAEVQRRAESGQRYWRAGLGELGSAMTRSLASRRRVRDAWRWWRTFVKNSNDVNEYFAVVLRSLLALATGR